MNEIKDPEPAVKSAVAQWLSRIAADERKWKEDFERMREDMKFAQGFQRPGQKCMDDDAYLVNLCIRVISQKVAALYARNPKAEWQRRERLDFQIWDENPESLMPIVQQNAMGMLDFNSMALLQDYLKGMQMRELIERIGKTLELLYQYQVDEHDPNFKMQLKALVRRVATCGVGYIRVGFARDEQSMLTDEAPIQIIDRLKRAHALMDKMLEDGVDESDPRYEELKSLFNSVGIQTSGKYNDVELSERLVFDFLGATSVIPDKNCKQVKGFIGARYITIKRTLPLAEVAAFFDKPDLKASTIKRPSDQGSSYDVSETPNNAEEAMVNVYEVLNKGAKESFFLAEGYQDYLQAPAPLEPCVGGFWPVFALTFNDVETEPLDGGTIFPPSDVQLMKHAQREWNRTRQELRNQRKANAPTYVTASGWLEEADIEALKNAVPNQVIQLQGVPPSGDVAKSIVALQKAQIDPALYNTDILLQDILLSVGSQEANMGPAGNTDATATGQTIAEQSRTVGLGSNVDDLDDFLSQVARAAGDIALQSFSREVVERIVGRGAVWPEQNREDFLNEIFLKIVAASSGRPNKALEIANWERVANTLAQAGANPMFMVKETLKRVDDRIKVEDAFPLTPAMLQQSSMAAQQQQAQPSPTPPGQVPAQRRPGPPPQRQQLASGQSTMPVGGQ